MTINEMLDALREGKTIACDDKRYMKIEDGRFVERSQESDGIVITSSRIFITIDNVLKNKTDYRIYEKPILDEEEKKYLSAVIKPFRDQVIYIKKIDMYLGCNKNCEYIFGELGNEDDAVDTFALPYFPKGKMYNNMEVGKEYTLKELGL